MARFFGVIVCALLLTSQLWASGPQPREILATGDFVPGFGRIGVFGFQIVGFDDSGRLLISAQISDGRHGLFWANGETISPVWSVEGQGKERALVHAFSAASSASGRFVAALGEAEPGNPFRNAQDALVVLREGVPVVRVVRGDVGRENERFCQFGRPVVGDEGRLAFIAEAALNGESCDYPSEPNEPFPEFLTALYVLGSEQPERIAVADGGVGSLTLWAVTRDGTVVFQQGTAVITYRDGSLSTKLQDGDLGTNGGELTHIQVVAANRLGDVLFFALEDDVRGLYRTAVDGLIRLEDLPHSIEQEFQLYPNLGNASLGDAGDAVLSGRWWKTDSDGFRGETYGLIVYSSRGGVELIDNAGTGWVNRVGELAYTSLRYSGPVAAMRRRHGRDERILANGDPAPGGGHFGAQGVIRECFDDSGLVAAVVLAGDYTDGLVCADSDGAKLIAKAGGPAPDGGTFSSLDGCSFVSPEEILFVGNKTEKEDGYLYSTPYLYRATAVGLERAIPPGDLQAIGLGEPVRAFQTNAKGTVLLFSGFASRGVFARQRKGAAIEALHLSQYTFEGRTIAGVYDFGLADDDRIVASVRFADERDLYPSNEPTSIVVFGVGGASLIATRDDPWLPGAPFESLGGVRVKRQLVLFSGSRQRSDRTFAYDLATAEPPREVLPAMTDLARAGILDFTPEGRLLVFALASAEPYHTDYARYVVDADGVRKVSNELLGEAGVAAITDQGNLIHRGYTTPSNGHRDSFGVSGPEVTARCLASENVDSGRIGDSGCAIARGDAGGAWILCVLPLALLCRRRLRRHQPSSGSGTSPVSSSISA